MKPPDGFVDPRNTQVLSISKLTRQVKQLLEENYPIVWIIGEISNLKVPSSGHAYFVLKDEKAQISAVFFRGQKQHLKFKLQDGLSIVGMGRISVYEPRGTYQIIMEFAEPQGYGALQMAFEQLKQKLYQAGLFDADHKKPLPLVPSGIALITSPTGAVIHDLLNIIYSRFPTIAVDIYPVPVQGKEAELKMSLAIELANKRQTSDVLIIARGGGSLEDLAAYNSEMVARAIYNSKIPVISAVGHETDFTIADFVADLRAPTPSAAAQTVVPLKSDLSVQIAGLQHRIMQALLQKASQHRRDLGFLQHALIHPSKKIQDLQIHIDDISDRLHRAALMTLQSHYSALTHCTYALMRRAPMQTVQSLKSKAQKLDFQLQQTIKLYLAGMKDRLAHLQAMLDVLNPKTLLQKGYSITRSIPQHSVITSIDSVENKQNLEILLAKGRLHVMVENILTTSED